jgi:hypothetical protein
MSSSFRNRRDLVRLACAAALATAAAGSAHAAENWVFDPRVEVGAEYDDNYRLTSQRGQEIEVEGASVDAELGITSESPRGSIDLRPRVHSTYFPNESSENATDGYFNATAEKRTQRLVSKILASFADESVVSSELLAADFPGVDLGQPVSGDSGRVTFRNRRRLIVVNPSLNFDWTQRRHLIAALQYVDADYHSEFFEQVGYKNYTATVGMAYDATQRSKLTFVLSDGVYDPTDATPNTNTAGASAEWRSSATEITSFYVRAGADYSTRDAFGTVSKLSSTSFNGGIGAEFRYPTTRFVIDALRSTAPSSSGVVVNRTEARLRIAHDFQPRFSGLLAARAIRTSGLASSGSVSDRKYATGTAGFEWRASRTISLNGTDNYTWQKYEFDPNDATSNGVHLALVYQPRRLN